MFKSLVQWSNRKKKEKKITLNSKSHSLLTFAFCDKLLERAEIGILFFSFLFFCLASENKNKKTKKQKRRKKRSFF